MYLTAIKKNKTTVMYVCWKSDTAEFERENYLICPVVEAGGSTE